MTDNPLKAQLSSGEVAIGLWLASTAPELAEIAARSGFDWVLIDAEHGAHGFGDIANQLRAVQAGSARPVVRVPVNEAWVIKKVLDLGAETLVIPMVNSAAEAQAAVAACRYAPAGIRGMAANIVRASGYGEERDYIERANDRICVILQIETRAALGDLDAILQVEGVDGLFIGPADLSADLGRPGQQDHPEVQSLITDGLRRIRAAGKAAGIIYYDGGLIETALASGANFVAVGCDLSIVAAGFRNLAAAYTAKSDARQREGGKS